MAVINVKPGSHDATDWCAVGELFGDTVVTINDTFQLKLRNAVIPIHKHVVSSMRIDEWNCSAVFAASSFTFSKIIASVRHCGRLSRIAKLYTCLNLTDRLYNTFSKKQAMSCVNRAFAHFKVKKPPLQLSVRVPYEMAVSRSELVRATRYIACATDLPASAQRVVLDRTSLVRKAASRVADLCTNAVKWASNWSLHSPWEHSDLCIAGCHHTSALHPRRSTYGESCLAFRADEYIGRHSDAVNTNLNAVPSPDRQAVFHGIVTGLLSYQQQLQRFTSVDISVHKIKELATRCNKFTPHSGEYISTSAIKAMAGYFSDCVMHGLDKNGKMLFISCKRFHWHLLYTTFEFAATGSPSVGLNYAVSTLTPAQYISRKKDTYAWSHIAKFKCGGKKPANTKIARADGIQKFTKEKARPMVRCHREPERLLKRRICRAGFFVLLHAGLDQFGIFQTRLQAYSDRWKYREAQGDLAATFNLMDDMSGFYTCLDRSGVLDRAKYVIDKFKARHRRGRHWLSVPIRGNGAVKFGKSSEGCVNIHVDEIFAVLLWASDFSCFMLGIHFLVQLLGLFQGCALSVILSLMTAGADEDRWLCSLGNDRRLVVGFRYFDDRFIWFIYFVDCLESKARAKQLMADAPGIYMVGIVCEPEDPPDFLESTILESPDGHVILMHNNKNWDHVAEHGRQKIITQLPRSSYTSKTIIDGHRMSRLRSIVKHANSFEAKIRASLQMVVEWVICLGDTMDDAARILMKLREKRSQPLEVWLEVMKVMNISKTIRVSGHCDESGAESDCSLTLVG